MTNPKRRRKILRIIIISVYLILIISPFIIAGTLTILFAITTPNSIDKIVLIFHMVALTIISLLLAGSKILEKHNYVANDHLKGFVRFQDNTWQSYIFYVIVIVPITTVMIITIIRQYLLNAEFSADFLLQVIYWTIAIFNFIWFLCHWINATTLYQKKKINLMIKLASCIISILQLVTDFISAANFTKQFIFISATIIFFSYLIDREESP